MDVQRKKDTHYCLDLETNEGKMIVNKSIPLLDFPQNPMTLFEMKLFDTYFGRLDSQNPEVTKITFEKSELQELLGVDIINRSELNKALKNLMRRIVTVYDGPQKVTFTLLSTATLEYYDRNKTLLSTITLGCSKEARKYIYNLSSIRYLRMSLARLVSFSSRHSYHIYQYLLANSFRSEWDVELRELKLMLGVDGKYNEYSDFDKRVLNIAFEEINTNTEIKYEYQPVLRHNRTKIHFHVTHTDDKLEKKIAMIEEQQKKLNQKTQSAQNPELDSDWSDVSQYF